MAETDPRNPFAPPTPDEVAAMEAAAGRAVARHEAGLPPLVEARPATPAEAALARLLADAADSLASALVVASQCAYAIPADRYRIATLAKAARDEAERWAVEAHDDG